MTQIMEATQSSPTTQRRDKRRSSPPPRREVTRPSSDTGDGGVGEQYLRLFGEPALADDGDTYQRVYHFVLGVLQENPISHVHAAYKAAWDAATTRAEMYFSGGQRR